MPILMLAYLSTKFFFFKLGKIVITLVYVDDGLFMGTDKSLIDKKNCACLKHWECCDTGEVTEFLGMCVTKEAGIIKLDQ